METQTEILVIGTNEKILQVVLRLLNANILWKATGVSNPEEAIAKCKETHYQVLLIGAGLTDSEEVQLSIDIKSIHPAIHMVPHYGGGSGLLFAEIYQVLGSGTMNQAQ